MWPAAKKPPEGGFFTAERNLDQFVPLAALAALLAAPTALAAAARAASALLSAALEALDMALEAALSAMPAEPAADEAALSVIGLGVGVVTVTLGVVVGVGVTTVVSYFLLQAARATAATMEASKSDLFMGCPR